ncbi:MAG: sulfite exporter TauE/SafE family protein [Alphaproteobacteria bacterium]|nr:sulfite exporter TauE/SafE family protein [Alphaproteobacteria bacterium]
MVVWTGWLILMITGDRWALLAEGWPMTLTMIVGSFIAGATSEGGGAVAFPVMTLGLGITPAVARDFSLMIQSIGMTAAAFTIVRTRTPISWRALRWASLGGAAGVILGLEFVAPFVPPPSVKVLFTSLWLSFAVALVLINRNHDRAILERLPALENHQRALLVGVGVVGGVITSLTGSGLDILTFSVLVLGFGLSEKVGTPTSVVLMAGNAVVGAVWKGTFGAGLEPEAWMWWYAAVPVVVVGAPLGARFIQGQPRIRIVAFLIFSILAQFLAGILIIPQTPERIALSVVTFSIGATVFVVMSQLGAARVRRAAGPYSSTTQV